MGQLIQELKRRNVIRVAIAYSVVAWLLIEVSATTFPMLRLPDWTATFVTVLLMIGFPMALLLAWAFEITPEGIKLEKHVVREKSITHVTGRKLDFVIIVILATALGYFGYDKFILDPDRNVAEIEAAIQVTRDQVASSVEQQESAKTIAVLPFVNMSDDPGNEYFSDGISEEILNLLAKIPDLRVIARTSSFAYKGKDVKIAEVARELNVAHVLEGSVRKAGERVRIATQLIRASDSSHLWSETYDRTLDNIFVIQDEIATAVVSQLKLELIGATSRVQELDPAAYTLYLHARQTMRQHSAEATGQAVALYQQALEIEPEYVAALYGLARSYIEQYYRGTLPFDEARRLGREAANRALDIDPAFAPAYAVLGSSYEYDSPAIAARHLQKAFELDPLHPNVLPRVSTMLRVLGRVNEAIAVAKLQIDRDPMNSSAHSDLGYYYRYAGRLDESIEAFRMALSLVPGRSITHYRIGEALLLKGDPASALAEMQQEPEEAWRLIGLGLVYNELGQKAESDEAVEKSIRLYEDIAAYNIAYIYAFRGEVDQAFEWLDKAEMRRDSGLSQITVEVLFDNIREDPRWLPFLERIGRSPEQLAAIEFKVTLPQ